MMLQADHTQPVRALAGRSRTASTPLMRSRTAMKLGDWAIILSIAMLPLYFWESGLPQPSHVVLMLSVIGVALFRGLTSLCPDLLVWGLSLMAYIVTVDSIFYFIYGDLKTLLDAMYWIYNILLMIALRSMLIARWSAMMRTMSSMIIVSFVFELLVILSGYGKYPGGPRYLGTFNDPNQMAMWVLCMFGIVIIVSSSLYSVLLALFLSSILVVSSLSRSGTLGLAVMIGVIVIRFAVHMFKELLGRGKIRHIGFVVGLASFGIIIFIAQYEFIVGLILDYIELYKARFAEKKPYDSFAGRGYDRLWLYPEYLLLGAAQGATWRFGESISPIHEIHSSWAGLIFQYGLLGAAIFALFIWTALRGAGERVFVAFVGISVMSLTIYGLRNVAIWILLAVASAAAAQARGSARASRGGHGERAERLAWRKGRETGW